VEVVWPSGLVRKVEGVKADQVLKIRSRNTVRLPARGTVLTRLLG
jgi:hypothetical protein